MKFKTSNEQQDITQIIPRRNPDKIFFLPTLFRDLLKKNGNNLDVLTFSKYPEEFNKNENIFIFTDGSVKTERFKTESYEKITTKFNKTKVIKKERNETLNEVYGYGSYIQSENKDIYTYGVASNYDIKHGKSNNSNAIELKAIEEALFNLSNNFTDLDRKNIYLYSDNIQNLIALNHEIRSRNLKDENGKFLCPRKHLEESLDKIEQYKKNNSRESYLSIQRIADFVLKYKVNLTWVKSHQNLLQNEMVDQLASHAVEVEKQHHFNNTSRIADLYSVYSFTKIVNKKYVAEQDHKASNKQEIVVHQKFYDGNVVFKEEQDKVIFDYNNHTKLQTRIGNETFILKTELKKPQIENKVKGFEKLDLEKIKQEVQIQNNRILSRVNGSNFISMLNFLKEEDKFVDKSFNVIFNIQELNFKRKENNSKDKNNFIENPVLAQYFNEIDNGFNLFKDCFKNISSLEVKVKSQNKHLTYLKDNEIYYLQANYLTDKLSQNKENTKMFRLINGIETQSNLEIKESLGNEIEDIFNKYKTLLNPIRDFKNWKRKV